MFGGFGNCDIKSCKMSRHYTGLYNPLKPFTTYVMRLYAYGKYTDTIWVKNNNLIMLEWATIVDKGT